MIEKPIIVDSSSAFNLSLLDFNNRLFTILKKIDYEKT